MAEAHRREWAFVLAATVRVTADLDLAEECVQHAYAKALTAWGANGIPRRPGAWLTTVARRRAVDELRREAAFRRSLPYLVVDDLSDDPAEDPPSEDPHSDDLLAEDSHLADDRLRLVYTCCHPALAEEAQVALTLRLVCGLSTAEIARGFLVSDTTMAARITRAKKKIALARIPYRVPPANELAARRQGVLQVVYLVFTTGHTAPAGGQLQKGDLLERALDLARMLRSLLPHDPDVAGLLALMLLTDARRAARQRDDGSLVLLEDQDRTLWDRRAIEEGLALTREALGGAPRSRFALMAAIAAVHSGSRSWEATDWAELVGLYQVLAESWPSPVVALNSAVATGLAFGPEAGLEALASLWSEPQLAGYPYLAAARADFLRRLGRLDEARLSYEEALYLTENEVERAFLGGRLRGLSGAGAEQPQKPTDE